MSLPVNSITPKVVDEWLWSLKETCSRKSDTTQRKNFGKELDLLSLILRHYEKYNDDNIFRFPIKQRHRDDMWFVQRTGKKDRDLPREQFEIIRAKKQSLYGDVWWSLFTLQWCAALRISEAAAIHWEYVHLDFRNPNKSFICVCRHAEWPRQKDVASRIMPGFKNSKALGGQKIIPLFPESFEAIKRLHYIEAKGLVFKNPAGSFLEYHKIQMRYASAFSKSGIEYTGTHSLRHGSCRDLYNETGGVNLDNLLR